MHLINPQDAITSMMSLNKTHFDAYHTYGVWWQPNSAPDAGDGFVRFYIDGGFGTRRVTDLQVLFLLLPSCCLDLNSSRADMQYMSLEFLVKY